MAIKQNKLNANDEVVVSDDLKMTDGVPNNSDVAALFTRGDRSAWPIDASVRIRFEVSTPPLRAFGDVLSLGRGGDTSQLTRSI